MNQFALVTDMIIIIIDNKCALLNYAQRTTVIIQRDTAENNWLDTVFSKRTVCFVWTIRYTYTYGFKHGFKQSFSIFLY